MSPVTSWTGESACALQAALRMTNEAFAEHLGIGVRTVASWHQRPDVQPIASMQQILDTALERCSPEERRRFDQLTGPAVDEKALAEAERLINEDAHVGSSLDWLDRRAGWSSGTARRKVIERLAATDKGELDARRRRRTKLEHGRLAAAVRDYYGAHDGYGIYRGVYADASLGTTMLSHPDWLDLGTELTPDTDRLQLSNGATHPPNIDTTTSESAVKRVAEGIALKTRIYDLPLYDLRTIDVHGGAIAGTVTMNQFVEYALTLDMLESELSDALTQNTPHTPGSLPLRDHYLPNLDKVLAVGDRICAGGPIALFAIARPASTHQPADYLILVQERSGHVLNAARRLSLMQGFHQPMIDYRTETRIALTLMRELEEEMFGREELDNTVSDPRHADPMHPSRLTRPMRWLTKSPNRMRMETTGFALNLLNGNYEIANLIVVEDERFWDKFGGHIEANWESGSLRRYSSRDRELLIELINDQAWTSGGLFTLLQGLRRLAELAPERVDLPELTWALD